MSDRSDNEGFEDQERDQLENEWWRPDQTQDSGSGSGSGDESSEEDNEEDDDDDDVDDVNDVNDNDHPILGDKRDLKLCPKHNPGDMTRSCPSCSMALSLIGDKKTIRELCSSSSDSKDSSLSARYSGGCDAVIPTLSLDSDTIVLASNIFSKGVMRDKAWKETMKSFLLLPTEQHDQLTLNIQIEDLLKRYKSESRFQHIFAFLKEFLECLRNHRVAQRPIFALMERTNVDLQKVRCIGEKAGIKFPAVSPVKKDGVHVPRAGRSVPNQLGYEKFDEILPRPDLSVLIEELGLSDDAATAIAEEMEKYRKTVSKKFMELYDVSADHLNASEDWLIFFSDCLSHSDGSFRELARNKVVSLFRKDVKSELLEQTSSKKMKDQKSEGILGGQFFFKLIQLNIEFLLCSR